MSTNVRPNISEEHPYWIDKHRFYELKHFCLQYLQWKKSYNTVSELGPRLYSQMYAKGNKPTDPTAKAAEEKLFYSNRIEMVERTAKEADAVLAPYLIKGVTEGLSYEYLKSRLDIPASKDTYYDRYRKFFWLLSKARA